MEIDKSDALLRKKLENYTEAPPPRVWERIEASLNQKKNKRIVPLWISLGSVAAILLVGLMLFGPLTTSTPTRNNSISNSERTTEKTVPTRPTIQDLPSKKPGMLSRENGVQIANSFNAEASRIPGDEKSSVTNDVSYESVPAPGTMASQVASQTETRAGFAEKGDENTSDSDQNSPEVTFLSDPKLESPSSPFTTNEALEASDEIKKNNWSVGPQVAPVYYGWMGEGSPIAPSFAGNSKSGMVNFSYGLSVSYTISKKVSLRSGINKVDLGYQTNEVAFTSSFISRPSSLIRTINYSENSKNVVVHSTSATSAVAPNTVVSDLLVPSPEREGQMVQQFGYLEVPLELQFALVQKKWGLNVIGGMSSLFLLENSVSLAADGNSLEIGEASNMNLLNFSSNLGLGAYYKLHPDLQFTVQPMFKWHLNAFSETSGKFRPYTLGVYSGLSFKF